MRKWSPAQHKKFAATWKAKRAKRGTRVHAAGRAPAPARTGQHEVIALLKQAERTATKQLRDGDIRQFDQSHLLSMMALRMLEGKA